jgi:hypothetical protein
MSITKFMLARFARWPPQAVKGTRFVRAVETPSLTWR